MPVSSRYRRAWDWRGPFAAWLLLFAWLACGHASVAAQGAPDEHRLKAAFLYRFPQFVEWPAQATAGRTTLDMCVLGPDPFDGVLEELAEGEQLEGRALKVRHPEGDRIDDCHILYLPATQARRREILRRLNDAPILTVSDAPTFLDEGGMIQLFLRENRLRFNINAGAAEKARIRLSAQLLRLAQTVRGGPQ
jgi:hypothetical protein